MDQPPVNTVLRHIRKLAIAETARKQSDRDLLREFIEHRDEEAFATIMQRHGGIVMNVIRSVLTREKDAEDVFQVTFFVLAQKVRSIRKRSSLASWLHGVAYRLACKYRTGEARRRAVENQALSQKTTAMDDLTWRELREVLHAEIGRLAEKHRAPLLLCYWGSKTQEEAAAELGWPLGTLKDRLAKARDLLRARLTRRGFELAVPLFATMLSRKSATAAVPELLVRSTVAGAALVATGKPIPVNCVSTAAMALLRGTFKGMLASKLNWALILVFSVGSLALCSALAVHRLPSEHVLSDLDDDVPHEAPSRTDRYGDPLPEGAIARLGTIRFRNEAGVSRFVLTPDNSTIATMAAKTVTLWETKTGRPRARFTMLVDVDSMALAPDGKMLAVGGRDCILRLLDASSGKEIRQYVGHQGTGDRHTFSGVSGVLFLPGGRALVTWGSDKTIRLWETDTGKELRQFETEDCALWSGDLSSDGKLLVAVCASKSDYAVQLWNVETGRLVRRIPCSDQLARVVFSPDDKRLAATMFKSGQPGKVVLWEVATGKEVGTLVASDDATFSVAFSPDGTALTTGGIDQMIRVWDLASGKERHKIGPLGSSVQQVAFARNGKVLFSSGSAHRIRLWELPTGKEMLGLDTPDSGIGTVAYAPTGKLLASASMKTIWIWDVVTTKLVHKLDGHEGSVSAMVFSGNGKFLASASHDGTFRLWNTDSGKEQRRVKASNGYYSHLALSPDGTKLAWNSDDEPGIISLWDVSMGKESRRLAVRPEQPGVRPMISSLSFSADGINLVASSGTHVVLLGWNVATGKELSLPGKHDGGLNWVAFSPDGRSMATATMDGSVFLRETATGQARLIVKDAGYTTTLAFSPDARFLALGNNGSHSHVTSDKKLVQSGFENRNQVRLLDLSNGKVIHTFSGHIGPIDALAFSPDGKTLSSGSRDATVLIWDVAAYVRDTAMPGRQLLATDLDTMWSDLDGDVSKAYRSIITLAAAPAQALTLLKDRLHPVVAANPKHVSSLLKQLDSDRFPDREKAMAELKKMADAAEPALQQALSSNPSPESQRRLEQLHAALDVTKPGSERLRTWRALEILERVADAEAMELLRRLAAGDPQAWLTKEAKASLKRLDRISRTTGSRFPSQGR